MTVGEVLAVAWLLAVVTGFLVWSFMRRRIRKRLERLARRYGITPRVDMTADELEEQISRRFAGWTVR